MRRVHVSLLLAVVLLGTLALGGGSLATAQDADMADHPAIGSWLIETDQDVGAMAVRTMVLNDDGTAMAVSGISPNGAASAGVWASTGDTTANVTFTLVTDGPAYITLRFAIEIAADGQSLTGSYTAEMVFDPANESGTGGSGGQIGPANITGTRLVAEGPGTPVSSFEEFFAVPGATPEATPVS
jgi:hypothetical protein